VRLVSTVGDRRSAVSDRDMLWTEALFGPESA